MSPIPKPTPALTPPSRRSTRLAGAGSVVAAVLVSAVLTALACDPASAQELKSRSGDPIEILADEALEWRREDKQYVAQGNAVAIQGQNRVHADRLIASYRESGRANAPGAPGPSSTSDTDIYRIEAVGHVRITLPDQTITGTRAVRETDQGLIWIVGNPPTLKTRNEVVTASDRLEYWEKTGTAIAKGNATARNTETGHSIRADVLEADLGNGPGNRAASAPAAGGPDKSSGIREIRARGNVVIETDAETVVGDHGVYRPETGVATLEGNVLLMSNDGRQVSGNRAEVNMKTGISRITRGDAAPGAADGSGQVRAIFDTGDKE
ncbi:hypothetical protein IHV25_02930 [Phaeovibrio sulfidiphilus]|uniref:Organic solvent tolerance-like N-terminal domain-containing protein n=1 Tax=Phaeovibrio sulfidiphilus TaxID=1220600 RepID=A0A8J6YI16_9PROT|nr:LptA/OstA family protein [Phaeovibrio sulfidiphilus]MBE1236606.1 hypothetical protein [Phaeovibrio sulfidiphilus]